MDEVVDPAAAGLRGPPRGADALGLAGSAGQREGGPAQPSRILNSNSLSFKKECLRRIIKDILRAKLK